MRKGERRKQELLKIAYTPVFFPGQSHGQRSLAGYNPWGHKESDRTEHTFVYFILAKMRGMFPDQGLNLSPLP